jgi:hypothetical protein
MQYASTLLLKFSVRYVHPNYLFYCFNCVCIVCPNLSSAPCIGNYHDIYGKKLISVSERILLKKLTFFPLDWRMAGISAETRHFIRDVIDRRDNTWLQLDVCPSWRDNGRCSRQARTPEPDKYLEQGQRDGVTKNLYGS